MKFQNKKKSSKNLRNKSELANKILKKKAKTFQHKAFVKDNKTHKIADTLTEK